MALPPPPPGLDLTETQVPRILGVNISTFVIAIISVALRFVCRRMTRAPLWWDDWLMIPSLLASAVILFTSLCWMVPRGLGVHIWAAKPDAVLVWAESLFIHEICYTVIICAVKYSVLLFYWRLFKQSKIRVPIYILVTIVTLWGIAVILTTIFQCLPVNAFWDRFNPELAPATVAKFKCGVNVNDFFNGNSIPNIITDAAIVVLPIPFIWKLKLGTAQKMAITSIFILGIFIIGVSIARFTFIIRLDLASPDITWNFIDIQIWTAVECHIGITCACLPSLKPILTMLVPNSVAAATRRTNVTKPSAGRSAHAVDPESRLERDGDSKSSYSDEHPLKDMDDGSYAHVKVTAQRPSDVELGNMKHINVTTDVTVQNQPRGYDKYGQRI